MGVLVESLVGGAAELLQGVGFLCLFFSCIRFFFSV
jgi:hypothetical protein